MKQYFIPAIVVAVCILLLVLGFSLSRTDTYVSTDVEKVVSVKNTAWELVQYSKGSQIQNLVGTDWLLYFKEQEGYLRMCDQNKFTYSVNNTHINFNFTEDLRSSCGTTGLDESIFLNVFKKELVVDRVKSPTDAFKEVLTLSREDEKFVFVNRPGFSSTELGKKEVKKVQISAIRSCPKNFKPCDPVLIAKQLVIEKIEEEGAPVVFKKIIISTQLDSYTEVSLPYGTYQLAEYSDDASAIPKNPTLFSISSSTQDLYHIEVSI